MIRSNKLEPESTAPEHTRPHLLHGVRDEAPRARDERVIRRRLEAEARQDVNFLDFQACWWPGPRCGFEDL